MARLACVSDEIKVVWAIFSNKGDLEKKNSELVSQCLFDILNKSYGIRRTIFQKTFFVNTYMYLKVWYLAKCFMLEKRMVDKLESKALKFIYAGENERPVRVLNY